MNSSNTPNASVDKKWFSERRLPDPLSRVVLIEPLIPENTGNISRTCVATGSELHLVEPLGFEITASRVRRAGLDYWPDLGWSRHVDAAAWQSKVGDPARVFFIETGATQTIYDVHFQRGDWLVFGKETSGLSNSFFEQYAANKLLPAGHHFGPGEIGNRVKQSMASIPMPGPTRSLNLANSVAVVVFELLRQLGPSQ